MKVDRQDEDGLRRAIDAWNVQVEIPPDFQARVWRRIEFNAESRRSRWLWFERLVFDFRLAAALPVIALVAGFWLGLRHESDARRDPGRPFELAYVDSLDPYTYAHHEEGR